VRRLWLAGGLAMLAAVAACSSSPSPPASTLNSASTLACPARSGRCTAPGTVRWSVRLPGSASFEISTGQSILNYPAAGEEGIADFGGIPSGYLANVAVAPGLVLFQQPNRPVIEAIDPATGKRLWTTKLRTPRGFSPNTDVSGALSITLTVSGGLITAYDQADYLWWVLNPATGAASPPQKWVAYSQSSGGTLGQPGIYVLPASPSSVLMVNTLQVQDVDPVTGSVRWHAAVRPWTGEALIGDTLYLDNDPYNYNFSSKPNSSPTGTDTAIQRVDVGSGRLLPQLPLAADLRAEDGEVVQFAEDPGVLLVEAGGALARISPATGRAIWVYAAPTRTQGRAQPGPTTVPPTVEFLESGQVNGAAYPPPSPGTGTDIWRVLVVSLSTGQATPVDLGRAVPYGGAGINTGGEGGDGWNLYGSVLLAAAATKPQPAGAGGFSYTRLDGVDPQTGRVLWRGPVAADLYVLGETSSGPPLIIAESCAPYALSPDQSAAQGDQAFCNSERLYAINA
jgi:hypothetical protein